MQSGMPPTTTCHTHFQSVRGAQNNREGAKEVTQFSDSREEIEEVDRGHAGGRGGRDRGMGIAD